MLTLSPLFKKSHFFKESGLQRPPPKKALWVPAPDVCPPASRRGLRGRCALWWHSALNPEQTGSPAGLVTAWIPECRPPTTHPMPRASDSGRRGGPRLHSNKLPDDAEAAGPGTSRSWSVSALGSRLPGLPPIVCPPRRPLAWGPASCPFCRPGSVRMPLHTRLLPTTLLAASLSHQSSPEMTQPGSPHKWGQGRAGSSHLPVPVRQSLSRESVGPAWNAGAPLMHHSDSL